MLQTQILPYRASKLPNRLRSPSQGTGAPGPSPGRLLRVFPECSQQLGRWTPVTLSQQGSCIYTQTRFPALVSLTKHFHPAPNIRSPQPYERFAQDALDPKGAPAEVPQALGEVGGQAGSNTGPEAVGDSLPSPSLSSHHIFCFPAEQELFWVPGAEGNLTPCCLFLDPTSPADTELPQKGHCSRVPRSTGPRIRRSGTLTH